MGVCKFWEITCLSISLICLPSQVMSSEIINQEKNIPHKLYNQLNQQEKSYLILKEESLFPPSISENIKHLSYITDETLTQLKEKAIKENSAEEQAYLGHLHRSCGLYKEAIKWYLYSLREDKGDGSAEIELGDLYSLGEGFKKDDERADFWYKRALNEKHSEDAEFCLGIKTAGLYE